MNSPDILSNVWPKKSEGTCPGSPPLLSPLSPSTHPSSPRLACTLEGQSTSRLDLDLFHKLGYSTEQVDVVLKQFGSGMDTNTLLEKLVNIGGDEGEHWGVRINVPLPHGESLGPGPDSSPGPEENSLEEEDPLRPIVIDGSNVAMSHGNKEVFSCFGIQLAANFFLDRGHKSITVFVPSWRNEKPRPDVPISDQHILRELERKKLLVFTPSKRIGGKRIVCHDDRYIVKLAVDTDALIVSNDMFRDLQAERPEWKRFIEERVIMYSFVNNKFMPPDDPMGRHGPSLDELRRKCPVVQKKQPCPYGKRCTFGIKCRYLHPERPIQSNQTLADQLRSRYALPQAPQTSPAPGHSLSLVEDMAKKLTLGTSLKKDHRSEPTTSKQNRRVEQGTSKHSRRVCSKNDKTSCQVSNVGSESQELDSGLGSVDLQLYDTTYGWGQYPQPQSAPCCCRAPTHLQHGNVAQSEMNPAYPVVPYPYSPCSGGAQVYSHPPEYPHSHPAKYPHSHPSEYSHSHSSEYPHNHLSEYQYSHLSEYQYSHPAEFLHNHPSKYPHSHPAEYPHSAHRPQQHMFRSDPYGACPRAGHGLQEECSRWEQRSGKDPWQGHLQNPHQCHRSDPLQGQLHDPCQGHLQDPQLGHRPEPLQGQLQDPRQGHLQDLRQGVRTKLKAIFSAQLVDTAMNMNPQLLDPQKLAAEILRLQSVGL